MEYFHKADRIGISKESIQLQYIEDLYEEFYYYTSLILFNVVTGIVKALGVQDIDKISKHPPDTLNKGFLGGFEYLKDKLSDILGQRFKMSPYSSFNFSRVNLRKKLLSGSPLTPNEIKLLESELNAYVSPFFDHLSEEVAVKSFLLSLPTLYSDTKQEELKDYGKQTYKQIQKKYFAGYIPDSMRSAEERINLDKHQKKGVALSYNRLASYVQNVNDDVRNLIRNTVQKGLIEKKNPMQISSELYWNSKDYQTEHGTLEQLLRDWRRVAHTETMYAHETGRLANTEGQAEKSFKVGYDDQAIYYIFTGGTCDWCAPHEGFLVRQIPTDLIGDDTNDTLSSRGLKDPYTNTAIWLGKNNVGYRKDRPPKWRVCSPAHPNGRAVMVRIFPDAQEWDKKNRVPVLKDKLFGKPKNQIEDFLDKRLKTTFEKMGNQLKDAQKKSRAVQEKQEADRKKNIFAKDKTYYPDWLEAQRIHRNK